MKRYLMTFSYDGTNYSGYQKQPKAETIQGTIEKALKKINDNKAINITASGRTDAGVHALNQKAHFDLNTEIKPEKLTMPLNSLLPDDIYIKKIELTKENFDARKDAKAKEYIYQINIGPYNPMKRNIIYQYNKNLDIVAMQRALKYFEGEHNFKSFTPTNEVRDNYVRTIVQTNLLRDIKDLDNITLVFLGTGFLKYMVRNIVGTLIEIGEGKRKPEEIIDILKEQNRISAGITAPPEGLYLNDVYY